MVSPQSHQKFSSSHVKIATSQPEELPNLKNSTYIDADKIRSNRKIMYNP
jgi:hypothetical protein